MIGVTVNIPGSAQDLRIVMSDKNQLDSHSHLKRNIKDSSLYQSSYSVGVTVNKPVSAQDLRIVMSVISISWTVLSSIYVIRNK